MYCIYIANCNDQFGFRCIFFLFRFVSDDPFRWHLNEHSKANELKHQFIFHSFTSKFHPRIISTTLKLLFVITFVIYYTYTHAHAHAHLFTFCYHVSVCESGREGDEKAIESARNIFNKERRNEWKEKISSVFRCFSCRHCDCKCNMLIVLFARNNRVNAFANMAEPPIQFHFWW